MDKEIIAFIGKCAEEIGKFEQDNFDIDLYQEINCFKIQSPIEQFLYCALKTVARLNYISNGEPFQKPNGDWMMRGFSIQPQYQIGKYRVDFYIEYGAHNFNKTVIVECDSQGFHERTEQERRYEKARDRFLAIKGYKVFHYTGKELMHHPLDIAREIISYLVQQPQENLQIDSNIED